MTAFGIPLTRGVNEAVSFDSVTSSGTFATEIVQHVKILDATAGGRTGLVINTAGAAQVQHMSSATVPVSLLSLPSTATIPITGVVGLGVSATVPVSVSSAATLAITGPVQLGVSATIPVSVSSAATIPTSALVRNTAAAPVIVQHNSTATVPVSLLTLPTTATMPITGTVGLGVSATVPVSVSSAATLAVTGSFSVSSAATLAVAITTVGSASNGLGKLSNAGFATGDTGILMLGVRNDNGDVLADTNLDYGPVRINSSGNVIGQVRGFISHDATSDTNPNLIGGYADTATDAAVSDQVSADGDVTHVKASRDGAIYTMPHPPRIWNSAMEVVAPATDTTVKASTATAHSLYVVSIFCGVNDGCAPHLTKGTGTASMIWKHYFATRGDGYAQQWNPPIKLPATTDLMISSTATSTFFLEVSGYTAP